MRIFTVILIVILALPSQGQINSNVLDGIYVRENARTRQPIPYNFESVGGLMWSKRIWRVLDLREKINHPFYYPIETYNGMSNLVTVIRTGICADELTPYDPVSDEFTYAYRGEEACAIGTSIDTVWIESEYGDMEPQVVHNEFQTHAVYRFRVKEDWYFNNRRSVMETRIIGICPIEEMYDENGEYKGERPLYWIYMPEIRHVLANQETPSRHNDVERRTYDDLFNKRLFSSYVYQESNTYNRKIQDYKTGLEALLEGRKIEKEIFDYEQDLWEY